MKILGIFVIASLLSTTAQASIEIPFSGIIDNASGDLFAVGNTFKGAITFLDDAPVDNLDPVTGDPGYGWRTSYSFFVNNAQYPATYTSDAGEIYYDPSMTLLSYFSPADSLGLANSTLAFNTTVAPGNAGYPDFASLIASGTATMFAFQGIVFGAGQSSPGVPDRYGSASGNGVLGGTGVITPTAPETDIWAMIILGFGAIGASLRLDRRRRRGRAFNPVRALGAV